MPAVRQVVECLDRLYDPALAADWDAVGLVCGDPDAEVRTVLFAVDPVLAVVDEAISRGADLVVTHHPLFLSPVHSVAATTAKGVVVHRLVSNTIALHVCHTNADHAYPGVSDALAAAIGVRDVRPIEPLAGEPLDKLVAFVPTAEVDKLIDALAAAGAGAIGDYDRCAFTATGSGTFRPLLGAEPTIGAIGAIARVEESRVEMVVPRHRRAAVLAAMRAAHPYEEPAFDLLELAAVPGQRGSGRIGVLEEPTTLAGFAERVAVALPATAGGVRVAGPPDQPVRRVAVCGGAGDSLRDAVRATDADVYLTSDLRHHRAAEFREDSERSIALIDVSHWAAEWTWLPQAASRLHAGMAAAGATVEVRVSALCTDPWQFHLQHPDRPDSEESDG